MFDDLCLVFDEEVDVQPDERREGGRGGRRRGGRRGPISGGRHRGRAGAAYRNQTDSRPEDREGGSLWSYSSADHLNSHKGHNDGVWPGRGRGYPARERGSARDFGDRGSARDFRDREIARDCGDRGSARGFGDRESARDFGDRRSARDFGDRGSARDFGDRSARDFGDRESARDFGDRGSTRDFGDREISRDFGDRGSARGFGDRGSARDFGDRRSARDFGDTGSARDFKGRGSTRGFRGRGQDSKHSDRYGGGEEKRYDNQTGSGGLRSGRGARGGSRPFQIRCLLDVTNPAEAAMKLTSKISEFKKYLDSTSMATDETSEVLRVLATVLDCDMQRESVLRILEVVCSSRFLDANLRSMLLELQACGFVESQLTKAQEDVERMCKLISHICNRLPSFASKGQLLLALLSTQSAVMATVRRNSDLAEEVRELMSRCEKIVKMTQDPAVQRQQVRNRRGPNKDDEIPPDDFTKLSIFPEGQDLEWSEKPFLRANKIEGAYRDVSHYLDVQFRLLREDYMQPLRHGVREYRKMREKGELLKRISDLRLYHSVKIIGFVCKESFEHRIQFDNSHLKNVRWESSKRLLYGSLVCLSRDDFQNIYFAVVTNRDKKDIAEGILQVRFQNGFQDIMDSSAGEIFIMAETAAYFEAYRHVLEGLQEMKSSFPFSQYIVECKTEIKPPGYLLENGVCTTLDIKFLLNRKSEVTTKVTALLTTEWPSLEDTPFNESQYDAVKTALTKELAIIQGPPGTGKTYIGLKVAKVLLLNRRIWTHKDNPKPLLVVCYTNHALDQFLEGMLKFCPRGIVRVGSRCKNECLEEFNLKRIRSRIRREKKVSLDIRNSINDCARELRTLRDKVERISATLEATTKGIVGEQAMKAAMSENHFTSLVKGRRHHLRFRPKSAMFSWLKEGMLADAKDEWGVMGSHENLEREVMQQILEGTDEKQLPTMKANQVLLHPKLRAQMYRFWLAKLQDKMQQDVSKTKDTPQTEQIADWRDKCTREVLPDSLLKTVMDSSVYSAIARTCTQAGGQHTNYCVRSWLGFSHDRKAMQDLMDQLLEEEDNDAVEEDAECLQRERQLDDDDEDLLDFTRAPKYTVKDAISDLGIVTTSTKASGEDMNAWQIPHEQAKLLTRRLQHLLKTSQAMSENEASAISNVWNRRLKIKGRVRLYLYWLQRYQTQLKKSIKADADKYENESERLRELKLGEDWDIMRNKLVIGMTTTGAARYRKVLREIGCPIVLLEEAAEVLEAHVVTTLHESCQHLILIGDHQQLRPSPTVYELSRDYHLDVSLFERLVRNKLHHTTLALQHRMRPEIASLVRHVYPDLRDHVSTTGREHVRGVKHDVFLVNHEIAETLQTETSSKVNEHEADFCLSLCRYLLQQGYTTSQITLLTAYSGQVFALKSRMKEEEEELFKGMLVTAVDNYQGEENDIIVLSLVRSNEEGKVGFLRTDNRVCVALSRSRNGLYAIGNFRMLAESSDLWKKIVQTAEENQQLGDCLILRCENHPETETKASCKDDFSKVPEGGCCKPCTFRLSECGHVCHRMCHVSDKDHSEYICMEKCARTLCPDGHPCPKRCYEPCGQCMVQVEKEIPVCKHKALMPCHKDPDTWRCSSRCEGRLDNCGHECPGKCGECREKRAHPPCTEKVERLWPCGHLVKAPCRATPGDYPCPQPCDVMLSCGHVCQGTCGECLGGRVHKACGKPCGKLLPGCGHKCNLPCGSRCLPCRQKTCRTRCKHGRCSLVCGEPCKACDEPCPWACRHKPCNALCGAPCQPCGKVCPRKLRCRHRCAAFCGEMCICKICEKHKFVPLPIEGGLSEEESVNVYRDTRLVKLPDCQHIFRADALDAYVEKRLLEPGLFLQCPACTRPLKDWDCWRYHDKLTLRRREEGNAKKTLKASVFVSPERHDKIRQSMGLLALTDCNLLHRFTLKRSGRIIDIKECDINRCFALTNQIKLAKVIDMLNQFITKSPGAQLTERVRDQADLKTWQKAVLAPMEAMSEQRRQEMTSETRRLTYLAFLSCTRELVGSDPYSSDSFSSLQEQADQLVQTLKKVNKGNIPVAECKRIINAFGTKFSSYKTDASNIFAILNAPRGMDLCDVLTTPSQQAKAASQSGKEKTTLHQPCRRPWWLL